MIKINTIGVWGFEGAIRGMRMPYESFDKSDSYIEGGYEMYYGEKGGSTFIIEENDMALCKKLIKGGSEHRKFMRMIHVQAEVRAPRYFWQEADKYKWIEANSSSTMHLITKRELTQDDFSMNERTFECMKDLNDCLNRLIDEYNSTKDERCFIAIKQLLPESYNQLRMIDTNYECILNIYRQRKNHRLTEWREFCKWIESLPYMEEILGDVGEMITNEI